MGNGMIQAEIREEWNRHPPLLTAAALYCPTPWVVPHPALDSGYGAVDAVSHRAVWDRQEGMGTVRGAPIPELSAQPTCSTLSHPPSIPGRVLHTRKSTHTSVCDQSWDQRDTQELRAAPWP